MVEDSFTAMISENSHVFTSLITKKDTISSGLQAAAKSIFRIVVDFGLDAKIDISNVVYGQLSRSFEQCY